jgi:hypothetical protein
MMATNALTTTNELITMGFDMRWEYKVIKFSKRSFFSGTIDPEAFEAELNNLGRDGWELVSVTQNQMAITVAVLKRAR